MTRAKNGRFAPKKKFHLTWGRVLLSSGAIYGAIQCLQWGINQLNGAHDHEVRDDSSAARSARAVQWIDANSWKVKFQKQDTK